MPVPSFALLLNIRSLHSLDDYSLFLDDYSLFTTGNPLFYDNKLRKARKLVIEKQENCNSKKENISYRHCQHASFCTFIGFTFKISYDLKVFSP